MRPPAIPAALVPIVRRRIKELRDEADALAALLVKKRRRRRKRKPAAGPTKK